jgi:cytochrome c553
MIEGRVAPVGFGRSDENARGRLTRVALCAVLLFVALAIPAIALAAEVPPHVTTEEGPDACAMCHRAHTAPGVVARSQFGSWETTGSALVIADPSSNSGDVALCLTCHGVEGFGSQILVQQDFMRPSVHTLLPLESRYDEVPEKQCSSCHDAHGSEKRDDGTPYPDFSGLSPSRATRSTRARSTARRATTTRATSTTTGSTGSASTNRPPTSACRDRHPAPRSPARTATHPTARTSHR